MIDTDSVWLHFHCVGGKARTGSFMYLYDMMKNPDVSMYDLLYRQARLGANYPLYVDDNEEDWEMGLHAEKAEKAALLYEYVHENCESNYETPWSVWLAGRQSVE